MQKPATSAVKTLLQVLPLLILGTQIASCNVESRNQKNISNVQSPDKAYVVTTVEKSFSGPGQNFGEIDSYISINGQKDQLLLASFSEDGVHKPTILVTWVDNHNILFRTGHLQQTFYGTQFKDIRIRYIPV